MSLRSLALALFLSVPLAAGAGEFTDIHPEGAYPDPAQAASTDPYTGFIGRVQEKLRQLGFDAGPANGDFGAKTQTALGQFQLANNLPVSGQLDDRTLGVLGVQREDAQASAGSTTEEKPERESEAKPGG
ncbi:MAG TPA: peptidoglycan-binding domain-containing protein [Burkholderiales bacterium]|jgi:hypothetical protein|nr:peptidoglycan-binding domain-containing protein [Burkholderiales bacterium]